MTQATKKTLCKSVSIVPSLIYSPCYKKNKNCFYIILFNAFYAFNLTTLINGLASGSVSNSSFVSGETEEILISLGIFS